MRNGKGRKEGGRCLRKGKENSWKGEGGDL